ncbi:MAG: polyprenyl synthetase family protein [Candidatus Eremiobacteraeota bacterium]|nr:polyprenyl synthetase family protein [Candidatus Eremiobacteraeota bacterium]MBV8434225.1 polyprenyl synthetase family protein [Candidatus Eremiobacteraeota bacterium]MBV8655330.1 polyprenyl synthetase family protein [Candidatus Eremiobacteraeota bacterium]
MLLRHFGYGSYGPARRGKRLRPQMVLRVATGEGAPIEDALDAAVAVEIFHNYSLVHDDIEDRDELRHGRPTLWSAYGIAKAINAGDAMCALSFLSLEHAGARLDARRVLRMIAILHEAHAVMCEGQSLDLHFETETLVDVDRYHRMIACKTAQLFDASCRLGATSAGCDAATVDGYGAVGRAYGLAFQIRDDVSGIWSSVDETGKMAGIDIARRKWTFPVVWAISQPPSAARAAIAGAYALGRPLDAGEVRRVVDSLDRLGAREAAQRAAAEHVAVIERHPNKELRDFLLTTLGLSTAVTS